MPEVYLKFDGDLIQSQADAQALIFTMWRGLETDYPYLMVWLRERMVFRLEFQERPIWWGGEPPPSVRDRVESVERE